ncbi:hypothetical protein HK153_00770 [Streptococcus agalactiae]|nr:hypothetical protein [Streptococcus agalactiae]
MADVASYFELTMTNKLALMKDIVLFIYEKQIDNYADFLMICIETSDEWFNIAINYNTLAINKMRDAVWQKKKSGASIISEGEIGEVLSEDEKPKLSGEDN